MTKPGTRPAIQGEPLLYDVNWTCARLGGISRTKFYDEVNAGELETTLIGDRRFTTDEQQRRYIARKQRRAGKAVRG